MGEMTKRGASLFARLVALTKGDGTHPAASGGLQGDGPDNPYVVDSVADEYALLHIIGRKVARQSLREIDGRYFDVFEFDEPMFGDLWFDISSFYGKSQF
jgi:hypothetical protein